MSIEDDIIVKMPTKPEGPAQEPQHEQDCGCAKCFVAAEGKYAWRIGRKVPINVYEGDRPVCQCQTALDAKKIVAAVNAAMRQDPGTPAPSQPAGAREFIESRQFALEAFMHWLAGQCESYARQQTAAKDTEIERLTRKLESAGNAAKRERDRAEAAERERDSLREAVVKHGLRHTEECCLNRVPSKCDCGATDIRAALKAGKDGQQ